MKQVLTEYFPLYSMERITYSVDISLWSSVHEDLYVYMGEVTQISEIYISVLDGRSETFYP